MTTPTRYHRALFGILVLATLVAMGGPSPGRAQHLETQVYLTPGDHTFHLQHDGRKRSYIVHLPPQVETGEALPVVLSLHGGGGHGGSQQKFTLMDALADREGFIVVYPSGTGHFRKRLLTWNAGTCCSYAMDHNVDDVGFQLAVLDDLAAQTPIDERRIYATGLSNGAMMSYRLAVEAPFRIAAIAPVAGSMVVKDFSPTRPVPVLHIHSIDDPRALYEGGLGVPFPLTNRRTFHPSVEAALARWVEHNGCPSEPVIEETRAGTPGTREENHTATKIVYAPCDDSVEVILWKLTGAGHVWPGGKQDHLKRIVGPSTRIIDANEEIWAFFSQHVLPELASGG